MRMPPGARPSSLVTAVLAALLLLLVPTVPGVAAAGTGFPPVDGAWDKPGPFATAKVYEGSTTLFYPADLASSPLEHPVVVWGNGSNAYPFIYEGLLRHWASHGLIVAAAQTPSANSGEEMLAGIDALARLNGQSGSPFHGKVDLERIGSAGHSQGGAGAINAAKDPRIDTAVPIQPGPLAAPSGLHGPVLYLAGQTDKIVFPFLVQSFYNRSGHVPALYAELAGAGHFVPIGDGGGFRGLTTAWFRFQLLGDEQARGVFFGSGCGLCADPAWVNVKRNAKALAVSGP
ncbi:alpha/beta hydrolase family protein [Thermomonospora umbrina]|uniref:poly(ethylene terephthalate) hydrolase n=1 Tax=Thermomonospora umbrina TaxID=111806 RepID=A0A3D9SLY3_9ACTN|nr:acetylxylan esterase [Thermomonospora umbrina]REE96737.1 chlorophyllase-like protein [Thermomonospora umbrina]